MEVFVIFSPHIPFIGDPVDEREVITALEQIAEHLADFSQQNNVKNFEIVRSATLPHFLGFSPYVIVAEMSIQAYEHLYQDHFFDNVNVSITFENPFTPNNFIRIREI